VKKLNTVNVLEVVEANPNQIISFEDNKKGNKEAEKLFAKMAKDNGATDEDMDSYIEDGSYTHSHNEYGVYIIHSS
jgi:hypothetical protein